MVSSLIDRIARRALRSALAGAGAATLLSLGCPLAARAAGDQSDMSQTPWRDWRLKKSSVYAELGGPGVLASANYERIVRAFAIRIGAGASPGGGGSAYQVTIPLTVSFLSGLFVKRHSFAWEIGLGPVLARNSSSDRHILAYGPGVSVAGTGIVGFRQLFGNGMMFRLAYTPMVGSNGFAHWGSVSIGGSFGGPTAPDQCHDIDRCDRKRGACDYKPKPDGTKCDDRNLCTYHDACRAGTCVGVPVTCAPEESCRSAERCDPSRGCWSAAKADGLACDDRNACTEGDRCDAGVCIGEAVTCPAGDQCHDQSRCDPTSGCLSPPPKSDGARCDDGNPCTEKDRCRQGQCAGSFPDIAPSCNDRNVCTTNDICQQGRCAGSVPRSAPEACVDELTRRFRPYLKFSRDKGKPEPYRPSAWLPLYEKSLLRISLNADCHEALCEQIFKDATRKALEYADVREAGGCREDVKVLLKSGADRSGEPWAKIKEYGHGIYSHVAPIDDARYTVEYWILYPYNKTHIDCGEVACEWWEWYKITCAAISGACAWIASETEHQYDLTSLTVTYDALTDRIEKVSFPQHGCTLTEFGVPPASDTSARVRIDFLRDRGIVDNGLDGASLSTEVEKVDPTYMRVRDECKAYYGFSQPDSLLYMVKDPGSGRYEHPVAFVEWGTHENWPNPQGGFYLVPSHRGDDVSFLPSVVPILGAKQNPRSDAPFLFFGGHYGDPAGIMRHRGWFHEERDFGERCRMFDHPDPYAARSVAPFGLGGRSLSLLTSGSLSESGRGETDDAPPADLQSVSVHLAAVHAAASASAGTTDCERAFHNLSAFSESIQSRASERPLAYESPRTPDRRAFIAMCESLPAAVQRCLTINYARSHGEECSELRRTSPQEMLARLRSLVK